ncbi:MULTISPECIES: CPBP family intramembrane glutamic endopeptidase [unclassified Kitasatospora]|uniref:CPBP family intramembrane glutamic endopeptidase n=1 Tax=unclassified Kitasatospora TaxID=2633591 RepID=UPI00070C5BE5|nr:MULTISPECIES: CPBP family intramembrane glutamic endopeptidase [unclassified Kitasatospora]KQV18849.1 abortive phage infection protein [Kitasatospora sp. Root107]KRB74828.1 abortive phage infection protein [Kitasatospora sp. Root187]
MRRWKVETGVFLAVAFVAAGALGAVQPATGIPSEVVQLTQFGPAAGVAVVALLWPSRIRTRLAGSLPGRSGRGPADGSEGGPTRGRAVRLLFTALLIVALSAGTYALVGGSAGMTDPRALREPFVLIVLAQLVGACSEEIGWRCLLQPLVRTRFGPVSASVLVGLVWGAWHVQVFAQAPAYTVGFLLATVAMSVVLGLGLEGVRANRLLLAGGFHTLINLGMLLFMDKESGAVVPMVLFGAACLLAAVPWVLRTLPAARTSAEYALTAGHRGR